MSPAKGGAKRGPRAGSRAGQAPTQRQLRVGEEIRHLLAAMFARGDFRDPALAGEHVTVAEVRVSPDLKNATAFVSRLGQPGIGALLPVLRRAAPYLRGELAKQLRLRVAPQLSFQPDGAIEYATKVDALLKTPEVARDLDPA